MHWEKCEHVNEMLAVPGITSEYGKNCIAAERHDGGMMVYRRVHWASGCFLYLTRWGIAVSAFKNLAF